MNSELKILELLENDFSKYELGVTNKAMLETVSQKGYHLTDIGEYVQVWLLDNYCLIFEDGEIIVAFAHNDKKDHVLIDYVHSFYLKQLSAIKFTH